MASVKVTKDGIEIRIRDTLRALELLAKRTGLLEPQAGGAGPVPDFVVETTPKSDEGDDE